MENFYNDHDLKYVEVAICLEEFYKYRPGFLRFAIPTMEPYMSKSHIEENIHNVNISNVMNKYKEELNIKPVVDTNVFTIELPADIVYDCYNDKMGIVPAGEKFLIEFVGGDINNARFLERFDQTPDVIDHHQIHAAICVDGFHAEKPGVCRFQVPILSRFLSLSGHSPYIMAEIPKRIAATCPKDEYNMVESGQLFNIAFIDGKLDRTLIMGRRYGNITGKGFEQEEYSKDHDLNKVYEGNYVSGGYPYAQFNLPGLEKIAGKIGLELPVTVYVPDYYIYNQAKCCGPAKDVGMFTRKRKYGIMFLNGDKRFPILVGVYQP